MTQSLDLTMMEGLNFTDPPRPGLPLEGTVPEVGMGVPGTS